MKNIHLIPTDKPSRLYSKDGRHILDTTMAIDWYISSACYKPQNIYITYDEKPKSGDWILDIKDNSVWVLQIQPNTDLSKYRRIILTTDPELINNGVQGIDDEFLNWYVNNPGCEYVEVDKNWNYPLDKSWEYKIIIPKEEPKTYTVDDYFNDEFPKEKSKKETLEEVAEKFAETYFNRDETSMRNSTISFIDGAKWQAKEMYSEQEVFNLIMDFFMEKDSKYTANPVMVADWFEKNKKK